ncbi:MAG TPA: hypothetical protein PLU85_04685 [Bacteroidia bacterium]|nr:hypothetical protein [Bacteroidia bacterium]QQR96409.1 MAG: hypothetical protein IPJ93_07350 [Bacteroidota bacterium]MBP7713524.1 hypothetical protein [Bacteroidia bacterium]MBP8667366.1 hypothetical protein [Bacteroidia bacterium]HOZ83488.1 hypothetical protein [Bacteroidia bacterium]
MSNPIVDQVSKAANINQEQAAKAIEAVSAALKEKLPYLLHNQIDILLTGGNLSDGVKQKFETLKDDLESSAKDLSTKAQEFTEEVSKKLNNLFQK